MKFSCNGFQAVRMPSLHHLHVSAFPLERQGRGRVFAFSTPQSNRVSCMTCAAFDSLCVVLSCRSPVTAEAEGSSPFVPPYSKIHCLVTAQELGWPAASKKSETR